MLILAQNYSMFNFMKQLSFMLGRWSFILFFISGILTTRAATFDLPTQGDVIGQVQWTQASPGDTFYSIGRRYDVGYYELIEANPGIDPIKLISGTIIVIPTRYILPTKIRNGIVINLAELRVYYYPSHSNKVMTYPVGIGREGSDTPLGHSKIIQKIRNPTWYVPESIREERAQQGVFLPKRVLPGPDNPLGNYAMRLQQPTYLMHGTNDYHGVGRRSSSGCIRMLPEDIKELFHLVQVGTPVYILDHPYKFGIHHNKLYFEAHVPLQGSTLPLEEIAKQASVIASKHTFNIDWNRLETATLLENGIPQIVGQ